MTNSPNTFLDPSEKPIRLWLLGNDDTSYSRWFASEQQAREFLDLLVACQPLNFTKDVIDSHFTFTN
jgi:hypothetical protein